jgi:hypothetical protein
MYSAVSHILCLTEHHMKRLELEHTHIEARSCHCCIHLSYNIVHL